VSRDQDAKRLTMKSLPDVDAARDHPPNAPEVAFNPLWMIATAMAGFFVAAGLLIAFG
jgi:hypothetical protein